MPAPIVSPGFSPIAPVTPPVAPSAGESPSAGADFGSFFNNAVAKVESFQQNADASMQRFLSGEGEELHTVALNAQHAELSFDLFLQVRNKVISAYQEVMRMQV